MTSRIVPTADTAPANQVSFLTGWRRKSQAISAARKPLREGKKAVPVALVYLRAIALVNSAKHSQLPSRTPRLITAPLISFHEKIMMQRAAGTSMIISKKEKKIAAI